MPSIVLSAIYVWFRACVQALNGRNTESGAPVKQRKSDADTEIHEHEQQQEKWKENKIPVMRTPKMTTKRKRTLAGILENEAFRKP